MKRVCFIILIYLNQFSVFSQNLNLDFEEWYIDSFGNSQFFVPEAWESFGPPGMQRTTEAYNGNYAITLFTWYIAQISFLYNGKSFVPSEMDMITDIIRQSGQPFNSRPLMFSGYYKYDSVPDNDSAGVYVVLKKKDAVANKIDTIAIGSKFLPKSSVYKRFELPLTYLSALEPDSVVIIYKSGNIPCPFGGNCAFLTIDNLQFLGNTSVDLPGNEKTNKVRIYPNPATEDIKIKSEVPVSSVSIFDLQGRLLNQNFDVFSTGFLNIGNHPDGTYFLKIVTDNHVFFEKLIKATNN